MGYQQKNVTSGYTLLTATFDDVGGSGVGIQNIVPSGDIGGWGDVSIQLVDASGNWGNQYFYWTEENSGMDDGWYDGDMALADISLGSGDGFMIASDNDAIITFSGEVNFSELTPSIVAGYTLLGNAKPVNVDIQDIVPQGENIGGWGDVSIQFVDSEGNWGKQYFYWTEENSGMDDGWYDGDMALAEDTLTPADGFMVSSDNDGAVVIPAIQ